MLETRTRLSCLDTFNGTFNAEDVSGVIPTKQKNIFCEEKDWVVYSKDTGNKQLLAR